MSHALSRRGLFRAFAPALEAEPTTSPVARPGAAPAFLARLAGECLEEKGVGCRRCGEACEAGAVAFRLIGAGHARPMIASDACTGCGQCRDVCPTGVLSLVPRERAAFAAGFAELARPAQGASS